MNCTEVSPPVIYDGPWGPLLTESTDDRTPANQDRFTLYHYGPNVTPAYGGDGTQQTKKTVHQGPNDTGAILEDTSYTYNLQGRLATVTLDADGDSLADTQYHYEYNDSGIRVAQTTATDGNNDGDFNDPEDTSDRTSYLVDSNNPTGYAQVLEQWLNEILAQSYVLGLDVISQALANSSPLFLLYDGHGSTRMLVDATGQPLTGQVFRYDAFGNRLDSATALTSLLYSGEQTDPTGLQYLRARYYEPRIGRFTRLDPLPGCTNDPLSLHRYLYCHGGPITYIDPLAAR